MPFLPRVHRCTALWVVALAMLFSQLALAAYVCGRDAGAAARMAAMAQPCEGMDADQPNLCHQFAADASQSLEPAKLVTPSSPGLITVVVLPELDVAIAGGAPASRLPPELRPPPDPLFLSTLRLRV